MLRARVKNTREEENYAQEAYTESAQSEEYETPHEDGYINVEEEFTDTHTQKHIVPRVIENVQVTDPDALLNTYRVQYRRVCTEFIKSLKSGFRKAFPNKTSAPTKWYFRGVMIEDNSVPISVPEIAWHPMYISLEVSNNDNFEIRLEPPPGKIIIPCNGDSEETLIPLNVHLKDRHNNTIFRMKAYVCLENDEYKIPDTDVFKSKTSEGVKTVLEIYHQQLMFGEKSSCTTIKLSSITFTLTEMCYVILPPSWPLALFTNDDEMITVYNLYLDYVIRTTSVVAPAYNETSEYVPMILSKMPQNKDKCTIS